MTTLVKRSLSGLLCGTCLATYAGCGAGGPQEHGTLRVYGGLDTEGKPFTSYVLETARGDVSLDVELAGAQVAKLSSGSRVVARGDLTESGELRVDGLDILERQEGVGTLQESLTMGEARTAKLLVLMVHRGSPDSQTAASLRERLFTAPTSARALLRESSFDKLDIAGDVYGWYQASAASGCEEGLLAADADAAARAQGVNVDSYDHVLYYFPLNSSCAFSALGEIGTPAAPARRTWYNGEFGTYLAAHELGHNLGFYHAHSLDCGRATLSSVSSCTAWEYGDAADPMGRAHTTTHYNGYFKAAQAWLQRCNVVTAPANGEYLLSPLEDETTEPQVLRVRAPASVCPSDIPSCYYYVEYRQAIGAFDSMSQFRAMTEGLLVRLAPDVNQAGNDGVAGSYLLDMTPTLEGNFLDARLSFGASFTDSSSLSITAVGTENGKARVRVSVPSGSGSATCLDGTVFSDDASDTSCPAFVQPMAGDPGYSLGDKVTFNGSGFESTIDKNYWSPSAAPRYWKGASCSTICSPNCSGKTCGSDGCGGSCGSCSAGHSCDASGACIQDSGSTPCAGLCSNPKVFSTTSFQKSGLGSTDSCYETTQPITSGNCGGFVSPRTFKINGADLSSSCYAGSSFKLPAKRNGGYCFQASSGNNDWSWFGTW